MLERRTLTMTQVVRAFSGQQLVQQHAERIDIRRCCDRFAGDLFGGGVFRSQGEGMLDDLGTVSLFGFVSRNELRDTEVQKHDPAAGIDNQVRWLQVTMNDEVAMSILDCTEHLLKQAQS